jgi:hypothetical protein
MNEFAAFPVVRGLQLLHKFEATILKLLRAGIIKHWLDSFIFETGLSAKHKTPDSSNGFVTFSLRHLQSVFMCLLVGYVLSILVFILEISVGRSNRYPSK